MEDVTGDDDTGRALSTRLVHHSYRPPQDFDAVPPGVFKASTVLFPNVSAMRQRDWRDKSAYTYGLHGTPTTFVLEERIATLEGASHCVLTPSGLSAIALVDQVFLRSGDQILIPDNAYGPGLAFARAELKAWGIECDVYDPMDPADLAARITSATRLVWLEAAGSVSLEFPDLHALMEVVRSANKARKGQTSDSFERLILTALDNTWGAGVAFAPFDYGVDIVAHALTKYPSGGADVLMGSVTTRDDRLHHNILMTHMRLGLGVGANDAELVLRGLSSIEARYQIQDAHTHELALWMQEQKAVAKVFHPAMPDSPGHAFWTRDCRGAAALFSVAFAPHHSSEQVDAFCDALKLFRLGYSWAGPMSLCVPYDMRQMRCREWSGSPYVVRFAVGLEAVDDLKADLQQALQVFDT